MEFRPHYLEYVDAVVDRRPPKPNVQRVRAALRRRPR